VAFVASVDRAERSFRSVGVAGWFVVDATDDGSPSFGFAECFVPPNSAEASDEFPPAPFATATSLLSEDFARAAGAAVVGRIGGGRTSASLERLAIATISAATSKAHTGTSQGRWRTISGARDAAAGGQSGELVAGAGKPYFPASDNRSRISAAGC
jgi:hypothetical protein